jgi:hypothetical protein
MALSDLTQLLTYLVIGNYKECAEREGFEPPEDVNPQRFSRPPHSTTLQ